MTVRDNTVQPPAAAAMLWPEITKSPPRRLASYFRPNQEFTAPLVRLEFSETPSDYAVLIAADPLQAARFYVMCGPESLTIEYRFRTHRTGDSAGAFQDSELVQVKRQVRFPTRIQRKTCRLRWTPEGLLLRVAKTFKADDESWTDYVEIPHPASYAKSAHA